MKWLEIVLGLAVPISTYWSARIAGRFTLRAVEETHQRAVQTQQVNQARIIENYLHAIHDEIESIWELYMREMGHHVESLEDNQPLKLYYPILHDYHTVYKTNASLIGQITDKKLRKAIVLTYTKARSLIDSLRLNNDYLQKYEYWYRLSIQNKKWTDFDSNVMSSIKSLTDYASLLKMVHNETKLQVLTLLIQLKVRFINVEVERN
jgi:hypothetical protein